MKRPLKLSLEHKFLLIVMITSGAAIVSSGAGPTLYDARANKRLLIVDVARSAAFVARESAQGLASADHEPVRHALSALRASSRVVSAQVLDRDGKVIARYVNPAGDRHTVVPILHTEGYRFLDDRLAIRRPIVHEDAIVGTVYVEHDVGEYHSVAVGAMAFALTTTAGALIVVLLLAWHFRPRVSGPVLRLAAIAKTISREKNYGLRADIDADDEVAILIDGFNEMLDEIQARDNGMEKYRHELEREMTLRTAELRDVNARLQYSEGRLRTIVEGTSAMTGVDFFDALAVTLARSLNVRWVMIGTLVPGRRIKAQALWDGTRLVRDFAYDFRGTPSERVLTDSFAAYKEGVGDLFPQVSTLAGWPVDSYVGVALRSCDGKLVGILEAFHDEPMTDLARHGALLRVFASRAAAELERILVEEELHKSETRTRAILDSAADAIIAISASGTVDRCNPAGEAMFGCSADAIRGASIAELLGVPGDEEAQRLFKTHPEAVLAAFIGRRREIQGMHRDGTTFPINVIVAQMEEGGYTAIVRDVSRERELDRMKSDFVSTVSHEIRTPLSCIISSAKILREKAANEPRVATKFSGIIAEEGERLGRLINDLLDLSKLDAGGLSWTFGETDPHEVLDHVAVLHREAATGRRLELRVDVPDDTPPVNVDRGRFIQVMEKLLDNAMKFTEPGGRIHVTAAREDERFVRISIDDTGIGIDARDQQLIFDRFRQVGDVLTDRPRGTGLGLPICKEIVENFGGRIWVESTRGRGSSFRFTVPIATMAKNRARETIEPERAPEAVTPL